MLKSQPSHEAEIASWVLSVVPPGVPGFTFTRAVITYVPGGKIDRSGDTHCTAPGLPGTGTNVHCKGALPFTEANVVFSGSGKDEVTRRKEKGLPPANDTVMVIV
jgi:hypothetical protein